MSEIALNTTSEMNEADIIANPSGAVSRGSSYDNTRVTPDSQAMLEKLQQVWITPPTAEDKAYQDALSKKKGFPVVVLRQGRNLAQVNMATLSSIMGSLSRHELAGNRHLLAEDLEKYEGFIRSSGDLRAMAEFNRLKTALSTETVE